MIHIQTFKYVLMLLTDIIDHYYKLSIQNIINKKNLKKLK
jgi:hypothetical protein